MSITSTLFWETKIIDYASVRENRTKLLKQPKTIIEQILNMKIPENVEIVVLEDGLEEDQKCKYHIVLPPLSPGEPNW